LGEDDRVHDDHRQRVENGPGRAEQGVAVAGLELALDATNDETPVIPYRASHADGHQLVLPYRSSKRTMSSSPRYSPLCTSIITRSITPGFSRRCLCPAGMKVDSLLLIRRGSPPLTTLAMPCTTIQCSLRW